MSTHLQECGEEGREDKEKKSNFSAPPATWKSLVPSQPQASTDHLRLEPGGLKRSYEHSRLTQIFRVRTPQFHGWIMEELKTQESDLPRFRMNTNSVEEQRPSLKLG